MKFLAKALLLCLLSASPSLAQVAISGNVRDVTGTIVTTNVQVDFELQNYGSMIPSVSGTGTLVLLKKTFKPDASGNIHCTGPGCTDTLYTNASINPSGTFYSMCIIIQGRTLRCNNYLINVPFSLSALPAPLNIIPNAGPGQLLTQSYTCTVGSPATLWTCTHNLNDTSVQVSTYNLSGIRIFPDTLTVTNANVVTVTWVTPQAGTAVIIHAGPLTVATSVPNAVLQNPGGGQTIGGPSLSITAPTTFTQPITGNLLGNASTATSLLGPLRINTTQQNVNYAAEFANSGAFTYGQVRIGQPNVNTGMILSSSQINNATVSIGSVPDNTCGSGWRATDVGATDWHMGGGGLQLQEWHADSALTAGTCFPPSLRMVLSGNQLQLNNGTSVVPSFTWLSESPNPGTGLFRTSTPCLGFSVSNGVYSSPSGLGQMLLCNNLIQPVTDNVLAFGDATHRIPIIYAVTMECGTAGNISCIQSDGSNNMFIGNGNVGSGGITISNGAGSLNLNGGLSQGNGTGYQAKRTTTGCSTSGALAAVCPTTVTWPVAFPNANYTVHCNGLLIAQGVPLEGGITNQVAASVAFQTVAATAAVAQFTNIVCSAFHD